MEDIEKLKMIIKEYESSNTPLTKPKVKKDEPKPVDKKPIEVNPEEVVKELPPAQQPIEDIKQEVVKEKPKNPKHLHKWKR